MKIFLLLTLKLTKIQKKNFKKIEAWKEVDKPYIDTADIWNQVWISAGKQGDTALHNVYKKVRNQYHFQVRRCRRVADM